MKLIDKDAVVAEIKKQRNAYISEPSKYKVLSRILSFLDTLEVKEVDLDKEIQDLIYNRFFDLEGIAIVGSSLYATVEDMIYIAKHFFELGLRSTITEEDCKLIWNIGDEIPNMPEEEFFKELLRRYKTQKGE